MIRAILNGNKTQTRRVIKVQPDKHGDIYPYNDWKAMKKCPYGQSGDRLWVRETHRAVLLGDQPFLSYRATSDTDEPDRYPITVAQYDSIAGKPGSWRPSIFMPRWASRITLEVTCVNPQELQAISEDDAADEGIERHRGPYILDFAKAWDSINAERGYSWGSNPWVWVVKFKVQNGI